MPARADTAVAELSVHLGIAPEEAALYLHLCVAGPSKASDLSEALHVHRNEVYRTAERLTAQGVVRVSEERPARYAAVDLSELFDLQLQQRLAAIEALRATREEIRALLEAMRPVADAPAQSTYKVIRGRREIYAFRRRMIQGATQSLDWATTFPAAIRLWEDSGEAPLVRRRAAEGIRFRALLAPSPGFDDAVRWFDELPSAEIRAFAARGLVRFLIADDKDLLIFVVNDGSASLAAEDEVAIHTTAPGFVHAQRIFFEQSWNAHRAAGPAPEPPQGPLPLGLMDVLAAAPRGETNGPSAR